MTSQFRKRKGKPRTARDRSPLTRKITPGFGPHEEKSRKEKAYTQGRSTVSEDEDEEYIRFKNPDRKTMRKLTPHDNLTDQADQLEEHLRCFRRCLAKYDEKNQLNFIYQTSNFAAGYFDSRGGFLEIEALNVSLFVPPGAIQNDQKTEVYLYVDTERESRTSHAHTVIAPIVQCGPPGLKFSESVVLTFPHCAEEESKWKFVALTCQSDERHQAKGEWKDLQTDDARDDAVYMVDRGRAVLLITHFTLYTLAGEQKSDDTTVKKKMRVGAFGPSFSRRHDSYQFRVRAWDDTEASLDNVLKKENRLSGQQLDADRQISVVNTGDSVDVNMSNLKPGWKNRYEEPEGQEFPFTDLWQLDVLPSCTFDVKMDVSSDDHNNNPRVSSGVYCKVGVHQQNSSADAVKLNINVNETSEITGSCATRHSQTFSGAVQEKLFGPLDPKSGLSTLAYYKLCETLNLESVIDQDWRPLAEKLGCSFMTIENIRGNKSEEPIKLVLKVFFSRYSNTKNAVEYLRKILNEIGLTAAATIIEIDIVRPADDGSDPTED